MATEIRGVRATFKTPGLNAAKSSMNSASRAASKLHKQLAGVAAATGGMGVAMQVATGAILGFATALGAKHALGAIINATAAFADFNAEMTRVNTLVGIAQDRVERMSGQVLKLAGRTAQAPNDLARGLFRLTSGGIRGANVMKSLETAAQAAAIGMGDVNELTRVATSTVQAFADQGADMQSVMATLFKTVREGNVRVGRLQSALGQVQSTAAESGVSFQDLGSFLAIASRVMGDTQKAARGLRQLLARLMDPTPDMVAAFQQAGMSVAGFRRQIQTEGLPQALVEMVRAARANNVAIGRLTGSVRSLTPVLAVAGSQSEEFLRTSREMVTAQQEFGKAVERVQNTLDFQIQRTLAAGSALQIAFGRGFEDTVLPNLREFNDLLEDIPASEVEALGGFLGNVLPQIGGTMLPNIPDLEPLFKIPDLLRVDKTIIGTGKSIFNFGKNAVETAKRIDTFTDRVQNSLATTETFDRMVRRQLTPSFTAFNNTLMMVGDTMDHQVAAALNNVRTGVKRTKNTIVGAIPPVEGISDAMKTIIERQVNFNTRIESANAELQTFVTLLKDAAEASANIQPPALPGGRRPGITGGARGAVSPALSALERAVKTGRPGAVFDVLDKFNITIQQIAEAGFGRIANAARNITQFKENTNKAGQEADRTANVINNAIIPALSQLQSALGDTASKILNFATQVLSAVAQFLRTPANQRSPLTIVGGLLSGFAGFFQHGGTIGPGQFGIAGEAGPEIVTGPADVTPMKDAGVNVTIDVSGMPEPKDPRQAARDRQWQRFLAESVDSAKQSGVEF